MEENLKNLQYQIREQTDIPPHNQLILYRDQLLQSVIDELVVGTLVFTYLQNSLYNNLCDIMN